MFRAPSPGNGWAPGNGRRPQRAAAVPRKGQLQPEVLPQLGQAWQLPARIICTPHCMQ